MNSIETFDETNATRNILIQTQHNEYRFIVADPTLLTGDLTGGSLGDGPNAAILVGALSGGNNSFRGGLMGLQAGARALFFLPAMNGLRHLLTSTITNVAYVRDGQGN